MLKPWNAGIFMAKTKELIRRLKSWHLDDFRYPVQFCSVPESRRWVRLTFREIIGNASDLGPRPVSQQYYTSSEPDENGIVGATYKNPDSDTDRSLTQWLMGDFLRHLDTSPTLPALDYLKEAFGQILELPAWTVREPQDEPERAMAKRCDNQDNPRCLIVTGRQVPLDVLDTLRDAAEMLLSESGPGWHSADDLPTGGLDVREIPLDAPAGTPQPLKDAYDKIAQALFDADGIRRDPPTGQPIVEEVAHGFAASCHAAHDAYKAAETSLLNAVENATCAHAEALTIIRRVNDACGHVMLGAVPFEETASHLKAVPAFDIRVVLQAMRRQTSRATRQMQATGREQTQSATAEQEAAGESFSTSGVEAKSEPMQSTPTATIRELHGLRAELIKFQSDWRALRVFWARERGITNREELANRMKQQPELARTQAEAKEKLAEQAADLFMQQFVPLAARIVEAIGEDKFLNVSEAPPPLWRSGIRETDSLVVDLFGTGDTDEMGKRALIWAARAHDTRRWRRPDSYPGRVRQWAGMMVCDPEEEAEPKWRTLGQPIRNVLWFLEQQMKKRQSVNEGSDHGELNADDKGARSAPHPFSGGRMVFFQDRVELCGVDICSGSRSERKRQVLNILQQQSDDGRFVAYSGSELAEKIGLEDQNSAAGVIRDLRKQISQALRSEANVECGHEDVILSGGPGYRLSNSLSVQDDGKTSIAGITDIESGGNVPNVRNEDVRDVRNPDVPDEVPKDAAGERRTWILQQLAEKRQLNAPDVVDQFKCSIKTAHRDLQALKGEIEFVGQPRTGHYRLRELRDPD